MSMNKPGSQPNLTGPQAKKEQEEPETEENKAFIRAFIQQENKSPDDFE